MAKGASATDIIVALALGLIIIVGLGYLVWTWLGRGGGAVNEQYCNAKKLAFCSQWSSKNFQGDGPGSGNGKSWRDYAKDCVDSGLILNVLEADCRDLLKQ